MTESRKQKKDKINQFSSKKKESESNYMKIERKVHVMIEILKG
jgi:hypothetical protein